MKYEIFINLENQEEDEFSELGILINCPKLYLTPIIYETATISLDGSFNENLLDLLTNQEEINLMLENAFNEAIQNDLPSLNYSAKNLKKELSINQNYLTTIESIRFEGPLRKINAYIKNNPFFNNKKIVINQKFKLDYQNLQELLNVFGKQENIYIYVEGNDEPVSIKDYKQTLTLIDNIVNQIKSLNLSPYESYLYVYDLVRERKYKYENNDEDYSVSRDLTSVLFGDKIVCLGFAKIAEAILNKLDIRTKVFLIKAKNSETRHARVISYIEDEKYQIKGLYFSDPTFGSEHSHNKETYIDDYTFFGKTHAEFLALDNGKYLDESYPWFKDDDIYELSLQMAAEHDNYIAILCHIKHSYLKYVKELLGEPPLDNLISITPEEHINYLEEVSNLANKTISATTFLKALYTVRKIEFYQNPQKYHLDINTLGNILYRSHLFFDTKENRLLKALFDQIPQAKREDIINCLRKYNQEANIAVDIQRLKLTQTLKSIAEKNNHQ